MPCFILMFIVRKNIYCRNCFFQRQSIFRGFLKNQWKSDSQKNSKQYQSNEKKSSTSKIRFCDSFEDAQSRKIDYRLLTFCHHLVVFISAGSCDMIMFYSTIQAIFIGFLLLPQFGCSDFILYFILVFIYVTLAGATWRACCRKESQ